MQHNNSMFIVSSAIIIETVAEHNHAYILRGQQKAKLNTSNHCGCM